MAIDKRTGWLAELKVGDKIKVEHDYIAVRTAIIEKITPTGRIYAGNLKYSHNGFNIPWSDWSNWRITEKLSSDDTKSQSKEEP
jgi:hypothetical protein